jgi:hypothetical protein
MRIRRAILLATAIFASTACNDTHRITAAERRTAIAALASQVEAHYIDPAAAQRIAAVLRGGAYDAIDDDAALARRLSADLLQASGDPRLRVLPVAPALPWWDRWRDAAGIDSVGMIGADIGYIDIRHFVHPDRSATRYAKAFGKLAGANTIIIDLRQNDGGDAGGLQLLASHVVDRPVHYADLVHRSGPVEARWALPKLVAQPYLGQLLMLTGPHTSAEAENFAFAMQAWKRATIIGTRSAGVVTASASAAISATLLAEMPDARVTLPLTGTTWTGGVTPDVATTGDALREAKRRILTERLAHATTPMGRQALLSLLKDL